MGEELKPKRKILIHIETSGPGGAETVVLNIAKHLDRKEFIPIVMLHKSRWLHKQLAEAGVETVIVPSGRSWDIAFFFKLIRYCKQNEIDLIHSHLPGANLYASVVGKLLGIPVICTFHNEFILPGTVPKFNSIKQFLIRNLASSLVMVAEYMKQEYMTKGKFPSQKVMTIYNGVSPNESSESFDHEAFKQAIDFHEGDILIGNIANLRPAKGHPILIEAAAIVCRKIPEAKFLLIGEEGDGTIKNEILRFIDKYNLKDRVVLLGFRKDISQILKYIDIFMLSSISEGLPMSVVEAMRSSLPVVVTNVGGLPEVVKDKQNGYLVLSRDPQALAEKLIKLAKDEKLRKTMGKKGREIAVSMFSLDEMISNYQSLYRKLLK